MTISCSRPQAKMWVFVFFSFLCFHVAVAQNAEVGLMIGGTAYRGDIEVRPNTVVQQTRPFAGAFYRYHASDRFAFRGQLIFGQLFADEKRYSVPSVDNWREKRGVSFTTSVVELAILPEWRFAHIGNVDLYAFAGVSGFYFKPTVDYNEPNPVIGDKNLDKTADYSNFATAIPMGGGIQWLINDRNAIGLEISGRKTFTDFLDGLSLSANAQVKDYAFFLNFTFSTFVGSPQRGGLGRNRGNTGCPTFN
jgi:hypothetical protein